MKRWLLVPVLVAAVLLVSCTPFPPRCYDREFRGGGLVRECR